MPGPVGTGHGLVRTSKREYRIMGLVRDMTGFKNGVYVNSKRVTEHFLKNGDIVTIGIAEFRYEELKKRDH